MLVRHRLARIDELERRGVDAEPQPPSARAVLEDVPQVPAATGAEDLIPHHAQRRVALRLDVRLIDGLEEAGPARPGLELRVGREEGSLQSRQTYVPSVLLSIRFPQKGASVPLRRMICASSSVRSCARRSTCASGRGVSRTRHPRRAVRCSFRYSSGYCVKRPSCLFPAWSVWKNRCRHHRRGANASVAAAHEAINAIQPSPEAYEPDRCVRFSCRSHP